MNDDHPRDPFFTLTDPGRKGPKTRMMIGEGLDNFDLFALVRDVFIWRLTRQQLHSLIFKVREILDRLDSDRDRLFGGPPEVILPYVDRCWLEGVKTEDNPKGNVNKIRPIKSIREIAQRDYNYKMSLIEAKEYVERYQRDVSPDGHVRPIAETVDAGVDDDV